MIKKLAFLFLTLSTTSLFSQNLTEQLKNSVERAEGGSGAHIVYTIFLTPTNAKSFYAKDFDSGTLIEVDGRPICFELSKKIGEDQEIIVINLDSASYYELEVTMVKGKYKYEYKFYY